jgi:cytochrome c oxidase subunit 1
MEGGAPAGGWTMYPPLILQTGDAFPFLIFSVHLMGISSIMGAINIIVTILNMRAPDMWLLKMPIFVWCWLITAYLLIAVMPVLAGAVTMLLTDQFFGTSFFLAAGGGDPVMFQHIFWFFGHPEVYIMILFSVTTRWYTPLRVSRSCHSSSGRTTCSRSACHYRARCSSCLRPC